MDAIFAKFASVTSRAAGSPFAFILCVIVVLAWAVSGPIFKFSETWQLVINTGTTIVTFLMVFLIQNSQNRDSEALQTKLDELIRSSKAENRFAGIESLSTKELDRLKKEEEAAVAKAEETVDKVEKVEAKRKGRAPAKRKPAAKPKPAAKS